MNWEQRFVYFDEDTCIEITVLQAKPGHADSKWMWHACDFPNLEEHLIKQRVGYKSAATARRGAERWFNREVNHAGNDER